MQTEITYLQQRVITALESGKASDIKEIDISQISDFADLMIICSGQSKRQVKALADRLEEEVKKAGVPLLGIEGEEACEWILVDLGDVVVHIMLPAVREFYALEKLWEIPPV